MINSKIGIERISEKNIERIHGRIIPSFSWDTKKDGEKKIFFKRGEEEGENGGEKIGLKRRGFFLRLVKKGGRGNGGGREGGEGG